MSRKLVTIRTICAIEPIPGADKIELAKIDGWQCVVRKGEFQVGDLCIYFEIDSVLPADKEWSEFMRERKFRVKTIKLMKQLSQGLALPLFPILPSKSIYHEGEDVTEELGVKLYEVPGAKDSVCTYTKKPPPCKWLLRWSIGRRVHAKLWPRASGSWPEWFPKTDEERVQNVVDFKPFMGHELVITEKLDGQSASYFYKRDFRNGLFKRGLFGVCSRNVWLKCKDQSNWWYVAEKYSIQSKLEEYCKRTGRSLVIQGEIVGPGIQGNKYSLVDREYFVFSVFDLDTRSYLTSEAASNIAAELGLKFVPIVHYMVTHEADKIILREWFLKIAEMKSSLNKKTEAEGVVIRRADKSQHSFKAISNKWLLKNEE